MKYKPFFLNHVAIRLVEEPPLYSEEPLSSPEAVIRLMAETLREYDREVVAVVNLQADLCPINMNIVSMGALDQALVHPREIMKSSILSNAAAVMLVHNHPSSRLYPSKEDIRVTDRMAQVFQLFGIEFIDHVIVGRKEEYYSFRNHGCMPLLKLQYKEAAEEVILGGKVAEEGLREKLSIRKQLVHEKKLTEQNGRKRGSKEKKKDRESR